MPPVDPDSAANSGSKPAAVDIESFPKALRDSFANLLFAGMPKSELDSLDPSDRQQLADLAFQHFAIRAPGTHVVHVGTTSGEAGNRRMPIILVTDDMPFLVDSATATVIASGIEIFRLIHPILAVTRDQQGRVTAVGGKDAPLESVILMEADRTPARLRTELARELELVYTDVRAATGDFGAMIAELHAASRNLNDNPPPMAPHVLAETTAFLDWLAADNFILLGYTDGNTRLGILRDQKRWETPYTNPSGDPVIIHNSQQKANVHRRATLDVVTVRRFDPAGKVKGEAHFVGLFASTAMRESPRRVPLVRRKVAEVADQLGYAPQSHAGRALEHVIETFPREELFRLNVTDLKDMAAGLMSLLDRPRPQLFARLDAHSEKVSVLVYIPRDSYSTELRTRIGAMLVEKIGGHMGKFDVELRAEGLARVHYVLEGVTTRPDEAALNTELLAITRGWDDQLEVELLAKVGATRAARLRLTHGRALGPGYRNNYSPAEGAADILRLTELSTPTDRHVSLSQRPGDADTVIRVKIFRLGDIIPLSESVPILENFGFKVIEEVSYDLAGGDLGWIHSFRLEMPAPVGNLAEFCSRVNPALTAVLSGSQENDGFNALIPSVGLNAEEANWVRSWFRYLRQTGSSYGLQTAADAMKRNAEVTLALVALFRAIHDPEAPKKARAAKEETFMQALQKVQSIEDDRILRLFHGLIEAMLRTNAFVPGGTSALAYKFDSARVPGLPKPLPWREIWVYSPRVEGIHLRGGPIARGGLRWSDRRDDFRTEVLGLVKAQMVKNSVIVPTGAKGGFYAKQLPDPAVDRDGWANEGREAYKVFIRAILSITDNLDAEGKVVPPAHVVRLDPDDPYMVVAADKGTATFSDTANGIAENRDFWLGDAFASGGSAGYDHKGMGITARGAWVSVTRHFAELGVDVQKDPVRVAGVGDMSGDVFGNGMLLSKSIKLVAAFDHRHIFLDPSPDAAAAWTERARLFALPRSSWADYDSKLISAGGGVFPRTQKAIPLSAEVKAMLGVDAESLSPTDLISAILKAEVDLLWFGGIGTYIKGSAESNISVGDRANDAHRVNGIDVRATVIGEGANLGMTQAGRIEYAQKGGHLNTDFIDNSAGVDTSDHEVNIKIALGAAERSGKLTRDKRNKLLHDMSDEVAALVLSNNSAQTLVLSMTEANAVASLAAHARHIETLEESGRLDRVVEGLPSVRELAERQRQGRGLTRPELAILLSYSKMELKDALVETTLGSDPLLREDLFHAFPEKMRKAYASEIEAHRLRPQIVATKLANLLVNRGGMTLAHELAAELGVPLSRIASAFVAVRTLFNLEALWKAIDTADVPATVALGLHSEAALVTRSLVADIARLGDSDQPEHVATRLAPGMLRLTKKIHGLLRPEPRAQVEEVRKRLVQAGAPEAVVDWFATLHGLKRGAGVVSLAADLDLDEAQTARAYTRLGEALVIDWAQGATSSLQVADGWERLLAATTSGSFDAMRIDLIRQLTGKGEDPLAAVEAWLKTNQARVSAIAGAINHARNSGAPSVAMLAHLATIALHAMKA